MKSDKVFQALSSFTKTTETNPLENPAVNDWQTVLKKLIRRLYSGDRCTDDTIDQ